MRTCTHQNVYWGRFHHIILHFPYRIERLLWFIYGSKYCQCAMGLKRPKVKWSNSEITEDQWMWVSSKPITNVPFSTRYRSMSRTSHCVISDCQAATHRSPQAVAALSLSVCFSKFNYLGSLPERRKGFLRHSNAAQRKYGGNKCQTCSWAAPNRCFYQPRVRGSSARSGVPLRDECSLKMDKAR